jgi:hypothetical protein
LQILSLEDLAAVPKGDISPLFSKPTRSSFQVLLGESQKGAFKKGYSGHFDVPFAVGDREIIDIFVKQRFMVEKGRDIIFGSNDQLRDLGGELRNLAWAHALLELVYAFIARFISQQSDDWKPRLPVPRVRFAWAALAIQQPNGDNVYMIEEQIPGDFVKLINNNSAKVRKGSLGPEADVTLGAFLAFTQHVQYLKTQKQVFISDYQGLSILFHLRIY